MMTNSMNRTVLMCKWLYFLLVLVDKDDYVYTIKHLTVAHN